MEDIKKALAKAVKYESDTSKGEKSKIMKVSEDKKLTPIVLSMSSK